MYTAQPEISQSQKPITNKPVIENIPTELKEQPCWIAWEYRFRNGKWTKVPFNAKTGNFAKSNDPRTWATFEQAVEYYTTYSIHEGRGTVEGIGFMLASPYCGCDLDKCIHGADDIEPWARNYIDRLASYTEVSPSGTGAKLIFKARIPGKDHKKTGLGADGKGAVELYDQRRFFTITGNVLSGTPKDVAQRQAELDAIYHELFPEKLKTEKAESTSPPLVVQTGDLMTLDDADILAMACEAQGGDKFRSLYFHGDLTGYHGDHSRADQALCAKLAYWCGPDSEEQIDRLFRRSALYRDKWDRDDYRHRTIDKALDREPHEFHAVALVEFAHLEEQALAIVGAWQKEPEFAGLVERAVQRTTRKATSSDTPVAAVARGRRGFLIPELDSLPPATWHVHRHFPYHGFVVLFGPSGNFKSFVAVDLALCIATGKPFLGKYEVKPGPVVYIVSEGAYGIKKRIKAWLQHHGQAAPTNFLVIPARFNLQEQDEVVELLRLAEERLGCQPQAVFVDTLTRNFGPGDPNSLRDMQQFCSNMDIIRETTGGTVVVIHHTGWTETSRERSASNLRDDADTSILLKKVEERVVELSCVKQKDFEEFGAYTLKGEAVELGDDLPEDERWSLVFDYNGTTADRKSEEREAQKDADLFQALRLLSPRREEALDADAVVQKAGLPERTIRRWLEEAYGEQLLLREGTGKRGSPHRYWLSEAGATWLAKVSSRLEIGRSTAAGGADS